MLLTVTLTIWECSKSAQVLYWNHDNALQEQHRQADKCVMSFLNQCKHTMNTVLPKKKKQIFKIIFNL